MESKVVKKTNEKAIPPWLINGVEAFANKEGIFIVIDGQTMPFHNAPGKYQRLYSTAFMSDRPAQQYLKKAWGITGFKQGFEKWMFCKFGGIDNTPDIDRSNRLVPDVFNNVCADDCPHRGRFCGAASHLTARDVETLNVLGRGATIEQAAEELFVSVPGMKSRTNTLKEKTGSRNMAQLILRSAHWGAI